MSDVSWQEPDGLLGTLVSYMAFLGIKPSLVLLFLLLKTVV